MSRSGRALLALVLALIVVIAPTTSQAQNAAALHTDPLNMDPVVRQGYERFYILDYDGALRLFNQVAQQHPQEPMAWNYVLVVTIFRELYHQDLLDTTYYARDSFLLNKRQIDVQPAARQQIESLTNKVIELCDARTKANPNDKNALFARGYARGMHAVFGTLVDHSYSAAAHQGLQSKNDSEAALKLDPEYADAKMAIGIQEFAVASLPRWMRFLVGVMGVGGSKSKGLEMLQESAAHGVVTSVESRTILSLFLRHDARYGEALQEQRGLAEQYRHNYLFQLEVANLLKDSGQGVQAMDAYKHVLDDAQKPGYFVDPRLQLAWFGLGETQRGYNDVRGAANSFAQAAAQPNCSDWLRKRADMNAGQAYDLVHDRNNATHYYQLASAPGGDQSQAERARKYMQTPYTGN